MATGEYIGFSRWLLSLVGLVCIGFARLASGQG